MAAEVCFVDLVFGITAKVRERKFVEFFAGDEAMEFAGEDYMVAISEIHH